MTEFKKHSSNKSNSNQINDIIVHKTHCGKKASDYCRQSELNQHLNSSVSTKTVNRALNKAGYNGRAAIRNPQLSTINIQKRWCILEGHVRNRYSAPSCLKELEQVLMEEWLKIPLDESGSCVIPFLG